jgi:hypothetical protein
MEGGTLDFVDRDFSNQDNLQTGKMTGRTGKLSFVFMHKNSIRNKNKAL